MTAELLPIGTVTEAIPSGADPVRKATPDFSQVFTDELGQVDGLIRNAEQMSRAYAVGEMDNLHQVMIAISKAQTHFDLMVQVRNRMIEGVQDLMKMSI